MVFVSQTQPRASMRGRDRCGRQRWKDAVSKSAERDCVEPLTDGGEQEVKVRVEMDEGDGRCPAP
jgi:hypothetical protein